MDTVGEVKKGQTWENIDEPSITSTHDLSTWRNHRSASTKVS